MALTLPSISAARYVAAIYAALSVLLLLFASVEAQTQTVKPFDEQFPPLHSFS
jgi:hypothetical protein